MSRNRAHMAACGSLGLTVARGGATLVSAAWLALAARELSTRDFSNLALLLALVAIIGVVADGGYALKLNRVVADRQGTPPVILASAMRMRVLGAIAGSVVLAVAYELLGDSGGLAAPVLFGVSMVATAIHGTLTAALRGQSDLRWEAANELGSRILVLGVGWVALGVSPSVTTAALVYALADVGSAAAGLAMRERALRPASDPGAEMSLREVVPLAAVGVVSVLYNRIDVAVLAHLAGAPHVGWYAAASRVTDAALLPASAEAAAVLGRLGAVAPSARAVAHRTLIARIAAVSALPAVAVGIGARPVMTRVFGESFAGASSALRVLALSIVPAALVAVAAPEVATSRPSLFVRAVGLAMIVEVGLCFWWVPGTGALGAAWATVVSTSFLALIFTRRSLRGAG